MGGIKGRGATSVRPEDDFSSDLWVLTIIETSTDNTSILLLHEEPALGISSLRVLGGVLGRTRIGYIEVVPFFGEPALTSRFQVEHRGRDEKAKQLKGL